jgi:hypothetical protein
MRPIFIPDTPEAWLGIAAIVVLVVGILIYQWLRPPAWKKLIQDDCYRQALNVYADVVHRDHQLCDVRHQALAAATTFLMTEHGIAAAEAERNLRHVVAQYARDQSYELRAEGAAHEQAGAYDLALDFYQRAAWWQEEHNPKDYQFLQKCIARVRGRTGAR